jgi:hypothetical protein
MLASFFFYVFFYLFCLGLHALNCTIIYAELGKKGFTIVLYFYIRFPPLQQVLNCAAIKCKTLRKKEVMTVAAFTKNVLE